MISGGIDLFTVEMARGRHPSPQYDVAAYVFLPLGFVISCFCVLTGVLLDRGVPPQSLFSFASLLFGVAALAATRMDTASGGLTYALARGTASGVVAPLFGYTLPHFFGTARLGRLIGGQSLMFVGGTCIGSLLVGGSAEALGGYTPMLQRLAVVPFVLAALILTLRPLTHTDQ